MKIDHNSCDTGEGAGFGAAFIGLIIVANGTIYLIIGIISKVINS
ncbi:hypothetical protein ABGT24_05495 [Peribacillus frigoritolerans]